MGKFWKKSWGWLKQLFGAGKVPGSGVVDLADVVEAEAAAIRTRREAWFADGKGLGDGAPWFGIGLSGGGIRSASFCLGALQALDAFGMVKRADYLSTVSGGGFIGTGMVAAMTRHAAGRGKTVPYAFPYAGLSVGAGAGDGAGTSDGAPQSGQPTENDIRDNEAVSHIRDHANYLMPHGVTDIILSLCVVARGVAVNLFLVLLVILPLATITILTNPTVRNLDTSILVDVLTWKFGQAFTWWPDLLNAFPLSKIGLAALVVSLIVWGAVRSGGRGWSDTASGWGVGTVRLVGVLTLAGFALELQGPILKLFFGYLTQGETTKATIPAVYAMLAAFVAATAGFRTQLVGWIEKGLAEPGVGALLRSVLSRILLFAAGLIVPFLIYLAYLGLSLWGIACVGLFDITHPENAFPLGPSFIGNPWTQVLLMAAFVGLTVFHGAALLLTQNGKSTLRLFGKRLAALGYKLPVGLAAVAVALACLVLAAWATRGGPPVFRFASPLDWQEASYLVLINYVLASLVVILSAFLFSANANSLHGLYRDRLSVAFRLGIRSGRDNAVGPMKLSQITPYAPYLLVNAALNARLAAGTQRESMRVNIQAADVEPPAGNRSAAPPDPAKRGRRAEFFHLSRDYIGSLSTRYAPTTVMEKKDADLTLPAATAISGAAFSSNMGRANIDALTPTLALLNVRLGYWLDNPKYCDTKVEDLSPRLPWHDFLRAYLVAEAFGLLRTDSSKIYVTDGGHVDNLGLYQLLRRKCRVILIVDAEADPAMHFGALVDVERFARIDLGYRITIDFTAMQKAAARRAQAKGAHAEDADPVHAEHFSIGEIDYGGNDKGTLIYVKALVTGDEPDYVLDYERRYQSFPHETTGDQFFSEEQMEAYRALGFHALERALTTTDHPKWAPGWASTPEPEPPSGDDPPLSAPPSSGPPAVTADLAQACAARQEMAAIKKALGIDKRGLRG
ncbi:MAG: hypothetical protein PW791_14485 [Neorhizobium sp.]|nr:hypothetical protein [Neorhizobium sp.]